MKKYNFLNSGLICIREVSIHCKVKRREFMNREFMIQLIYELIDTKNR